MFLQSVVVPVGRFCKAPGSASVERLHGTAFLLTDDGIFMTARHVLEGVLLDVAQNGGSAGVFPMTLHRDEKTSLVAPITEWEHAPRPYDISIFRTSCHLKTFFRCLPLGVEVWQDVATMGYPASVVRRDDARFEVQQRVHKGYVQRIIPPNRLGVGVHPDLFELSFPVTRGMSGSPLFIHRDRCEALIGVCVGSYSSRVIDYEEVTRKGELDETRETVLKVEEFGLAQDIRPLFSWTSQLLLGMSLLERSEQLWAGNPL